MIQLHTPNIASIILYRDALTGGQWVARSAQHPTIYGNGSDPQEALANLCEQIDTERCRAA